METTSWGLTFFIVIFTGIVFAIIAAIILGKEKKRKTIISAECSKIDKMQTEGKISPAEAGELKRAVGYVPIALKKSKPDIHIKLVALLNIAPMAGIMIMLLSILPAMCKMESVIAKLGNEPGNQSFTQPSLFIIIFAAIFLIQIIAVIALFKLKNWGRYMIIILALMEVGLFPLGTALGLYSLWVLLIRDGAGEYFVQYDEQANGDGLLI